MIIGFSGTKEGMTSDQELMMRNLLWELHLEGSGPITELHHGWCQGADDEFDAIVRREFGGPFLDRHFPIAYHPGLNKFGECPTRGHAKPRTGDIVYPALPYIKRDDVIAKVCEALIATPKEDYMIIRSGTWTTIRHAQKYGKTLYIILPDGTVWDGEAF